MLNAPDDMYPEGKRQRCWSHKMSKVRKCRQKACLKGLPKVYGAGSCAAAEKAYAVWTRAWREKEPGVVRCVGADIDSLLAFYALPRAPWRMPRTPNAIERYFREVRRRTRSVGCFVNDKSLERMVYGLFRFMNRRSCAPRT